MATAAVCEEPSETDCSICSETYTEPKLLLCGHLLCRHCVVSWLTSKEDAKCPLCRSTIMDAQSRSSRSIEEFVDILPTDFGMKNIADAKRILNKEHVCCVCEDVAATTICLTCRDMFCQACTKVHQKSSLSKHHCVQTLASLTADELADGSPSVCHAHANKASEVFCTSHNVAICLICMAIDHKQCTIVKQETRMEEVHTVLHELIAVLSRGESQIEKAIEELDEHLKKAKQITQVALKDAMQLYDRVEDLVKKGRRQLTELAKTACSDSEESARKVRAGLLSHKGRLATHKQAATRADEVHVSADLNRMTSAMKARVGDLDCSALLSASARADAMTTLVIDKEVVSLLESSLRQELGRLSRMFPKLRGQSVPFSFHSNHGKKVLLRDDGRVAEKQGNIILGDGIVISSQPMETNHLYEVEVKSLPETVGKDLMLIMPGVVTASPDHLTLPQYAYCWSSAIVIGYHYTSIAGKESVPFSFHSSHGKDVLLRDDGRVAERQGELWGSGIVISGQPMEINHLYEVEVKSLPGTVGKGEMLIRPGVVTASPNHLTLPEYAYWLSSAIVIGGGYTSITGKQVQSSFGQQLRGLSEGSRVGVSVDDSRNLLLHRDGVCLGIVTHSVPHPAYALFDLWLSCSVAALPTTYLK